MKLVIDRGSLRLGAVNIGTLYKYEHQQLVRLWKECVQEFIMTAMQRIAVDTGMSMASLQPLASKVRLKSFILQSLRGFGAKPGHKNLYGDFADNNAPFKSRALGNRLGRKAYVLKFGSPTAPYCLFTFKIVVFQYFLHETFQYVDSGNWQSLHYGRLAFLNHWKTNVHQRFKGSTIVKYLMTGKF